MMRLARWALLASVVALTGGCNVVGWMAQVVHGDKLQKTLLKAEYRGLEDKSIAVLVNASPNVLYQRPDVQAAIAQAVSGRLLEAIPTAQVVDPRQVAKFRKDNPYWSTLPYNELARRLEVDRVVYVDLSRYQTHEPGNAFLWQGLIDANVGVAEAESSDPSSFSYASTVEARFPQGKTIGVTDSDDATIQLGMVSRFSQAVANLFHDHEVASAK